jgi:hypothetical protein
MITYYSYFTILQLSKFLNMPAHTCKIWSAPTIFLLYKNESDINVDCVRCGKRKHSSFNDPVSEVLTYLCIPRAWCDKVVSVVHNARAFEMQFILKRAILMK